ncbi:MAG: efflux RND transporter permease subunit [Leptospirales bacterium]|nr:efflux RND transporter permease subunit [Leptospirales bacterium]
MSVSSLASDARGFAGRLASNFVHSRLTPVIAVASIVLGLGSIYLTPKEEEPQISVPMIDIVTQAPGLEPEEVERQISEPLERAVWGLEGVEYVYSASSPHVSVVTVRFKVGEPMEPALVKVHHKILEIRHQLPTGASQPQVRSFSIDDVPFLALTFASPTRDDYELRTLVAPLARELSSTPDLSRVELLGGRRRVVRVIVDPSRARNAGVSVAEVAGALMSNNDAAPAGQNWSSVSAVTVEMGGRLRSARDVAAVAIAQRGGRLVRVGDVARIVDGPEETQRLSVLLERSESVSGQTTVPPIQRAVTISFAKRRGTDVASLSPILLERARSYAADLPSDIHLVAIRDYGATARDKSNELIEHLMIATVSVAALIALAMGWRASLVVSIAIPVTLALTLAVYYFLGYTLNRVTLFALIFSIGILVDDAIVVVENVERHLRENPALGIARATIRAVSEVGNPTILATFTVIAAILPMAFVRGLMGPYMKPIPVGASLAMVLSLFVAFVVTPWASVRLLAGHGSKAEHDAGNKEGRLDRLYRAVTAKLLGERRAALAFGATVVMLLLVAVSFFAFKWVHVKMLPFDNKNELQVLIDFPADMPLQRSAELSAQLAREIMKDPAVERVQVFAGEPAPFSFSGMVKHTFLRHAEHMADLHVALLDKGDRSRSSHEIIASLRPVIHKFARQHGAITKVLEIPPGPPVLATMVAEVYGPNRAAREAAAQDILKLFQSDPAIVDLDYSWREGRPREYFAYDPNRGGLVGINASQAVQAGALVFSETPVSALADVSTPEEMAIIVSVDQAVRSSARPLASTQLRSFETGSAALEDALRAPQVRPYYTIFRKNLKPVSYVFAELTGSEESPVYGILRLSPQMTTPTQTAEAPWNTRSPIVKWDGEWFITYEVFRDLGAAFGVVMILIYILVLGWFRSYIIPLIIMTPIPISLIGIVPGHAIMGAYFTATSMIGFIAGAGIIVRNSIILVDFIEQELATGIDLKSAVIEAGVVRFRPMLLTAAAVVAGSAIMLSDPIFQGLAISLIFGEVAATVISRFAVPTLYYWIAGESRRRQIIEEANEP